MEPTTFEAEQTTMLPPHDLVTYAKDQPEYKPLPVARIHGDEGRVVSRWSLTDDDRAKIAAGEDLFIEQLTFGGPLQPILPTVGLREMCPADPVVAPRAVSYVDNDGQKCLAPNAEDAEKLRQMATEFSKDMKEFHPEPFKYDPFEHRKS